jgi:hypothetical protein
LATAFKEIREGATINRLDTPIGGWADKLVGKQPSFSGIQQDERLGVLVASYGAAPHGQHGVTILLNDHVSLDDRRGRTSQLKHDHARQKNSRGPEQG